MKIHILSTLLSLALITLLSSRVSNVESANILGVFTSHSPSHLIVHMSVMKALAKAGHNVTVVTGSQPKVTHKSIKQIVIPLTKEEEVKLHDGMKIFTQQKPSIWITIKAMFTSLTMVIDKQVDALEDKRFTALYENKDNKFDLLIVGFFFNTYQVGLGAKFNCPIIMDWTGAPMEIIDALIGNPRLVATVPNMNLAIAGGRPMNFVERLTNFAATSGMRVFCSYLEYKYQKFYTRLFGNDKSMPSYELAKQNVSLVFCNSHGISEGPIRPNVPALIEIGGIQIKDKPDALPKDIAEFLDSAQHGAILFSLGSNLKGDHIKAATVSRIFKALSSVKQHVIWKWDDLKNTPGDAPNILYKKWLPQDDILAHPKIKLFITHAGKGGVAEAQYHGVPMLALPVFADQPGNADGLVNAGYGLRLDLNSLETDEFKAAIKEIVKNDSYARNVKQFSKLYRDRPLTARESVVYWTNYVLRYNGAAHMQSPQAKMNFVQICNLDVYALVALVLYLVYLISKIVLKFVCRKLFGKSNKTAPKKKQKKQ